MIKKSLRSGLATLTLAASLALGGSTDKQPEIFIDEGCVGYGTGVLKSNRFIGCTAVIIDTGEGAFYAHAFPSDFRRTFNTHIWDYTDKIGRTPAYVNNVGNMLEEISASKGINLQNSNAIICVYGEDRDTINEVTENLNQSGIKVSQVKKYRINDDNLERGGAAISYNTKSKKLKID